MLFSVNLKKNESRTMYQTELGKKFSEYREGIVLTALKAAKQNKFGFFRDNMCDGDGDVKQESDIKSRKAHVPKWLQNDNLNSEHIKLARLRCEETGENARGSKHKAYSSARVVENPDNELAIHAACLLYKGINAKLNTARMMGRAGFFDELGYLFVDWMKHGCRADQTTLNIRWTSTGDSFKYPDIKSIPNSVPKYTNKRDGKSDEEQIAAINTTNKRLLRELTMKCPGMEMEIEHQVCIRKQAKKGGEKTRSGQGISSTDLASLGSAETVMDDDEVERTEQLVYTVNLIDVSCRMLTCYTSQLQYTAPASFLCASEKSLHCIFSVSMLLKYLLEKVVDSLNADGFDAQRIAQDIRVNGINIGALFPSPARQKLGLKTRCVHMFPNVYNTKAMKPRTSTTTETNLLNDDAGVSDRKTKVIEIE